MPLSLTQKQLATIAHAFNLPHVTLENLTPAGGGFSGASVWKISFESQHFALRLWPTPGLPVSRILALHNLLGWLRDSDLFELPAPIKSLSGSTLLQVPSPLKNFEENFQIEPWMLGSADFQTHPSPPRLNSAMTWLARFHLIASRYQAPPAARDWFQALPPAASPLLAERRSLLAAWTPPRLSSYSTLAHRLPPPLAQPLTSILHFAPRLIPRIDLELRHASALAVPLFPCLRDLWHDHLLFTGDTLTGVIDPNAARTDSVASDLSRLLGSLFPHDPAAWDAALELYSRTRPLSLTERQLIEVYDHSQILLAGLYWAERLPAASLTALQLASLPARLQTIADRLHRLV